MALNSKSKVQPLSVFDIYQFWQHSCSAGPNIIGILTKWPWRNVDSSLRDITRGGSHTLQQSRAILPISNFLLSQRYFSTHMFLFTTPDFSFFVRMAESVGLVFKVLRSFFCENVTGLTNRGQLCLFAQKFSSDWQSCKWWGRGEILEKDKSSWFQKD